MEQKLSNGRRYLTADELEKLIKAARKGHYGRRNATLMLLMARHGLRVTEAVDLAGIKLIFPKAICTSGGSKVVFIPFIRSKATNCGHCGSSSATRHRNPPLCSPQSVAGR